MLDSTVDRLQGPGAHVPEPDPLQHSTPRDSQTPHCADPEKDVTAQSMAALAPLLPAHLTHHSPTAPTRAIAPHTLVRAPHVIQRPEASPRQA